ncbi:hypothetical protein K1719_021697 [Acacia pycnantha]|nr:hypothetical protein K1719_021697 [Acacia pycnantha]
MEEKDRSMCKETKLCEECKSNPWKYKCPGCSIRSCSLPCVKAHKQRTRCSGKRNQTQFVPICQFDDNLLLSDYNLLEDMKRVAESARRMRTKFGSHFMMPLQLKSLQNAAGSRKTNLLLLLKGMSKREKNQSRYDRRKMLISWTIEWRFHQTDIVLVDHGVNENASFALFWRSILSLYPKGPKSRFKELDMKAPIRKQLANVTILEFPVIHVFLPSHNVNFKIIKPVNPTIHKPLQNDRDGAQSPECIPFREEEIEDDNNSPNPEILDLLKHLDSELPHQMPSQNESSEQALNISSDNPLPEGDIVGNLSHSSLKSDNLDLSENMPFDFDSNYMDIYSDLMSLINPEEFINYEVEHTHEPEVEGRDLGGISGICPVPEELEEGEIAE